MSDDGRTTPQRSPLPTHRAPRYLRFLIAGVVVGAVAGVVAGLVGDPPQNVGRAPLVGYLVMLFALFGGLLGGAVAVLMDRRRR